MNKRIRVWIKVSVVLGGILPGSRESGQVGYG